MTRRDQELALDPSDSDRQCEINSAEKKVRRLCVQWTRIDARHFSFSSCNNNYSMDSNNHNVYLTMSELKQQVLMFFRKS